MNNWFLQFLAITLLGFLGIFVQGYLRPLSTIMHAAYFFLLLFAGFTFFFFGNISLFRSTLSSKAVTGLMMAAIMGRLLVSIVGIVWYRNAYDPSTKWFILPFFIFYVVYSVFENYKLIQLSKEVG